MDALDWFKNPRVCTILGVPVHFHFTFLVFLFGIALFYTSYLVAILLIFASVLAHEFGHVLAARYCGVGCKGVVMLPIGGVALLDHMPQEPDKELIIVAAGPLVSLVLAVWGSALAMMTFSITDTFVILGLGNFALFAFNCLPVLPLDGGRIFRAVLHYWLSYEKSTMIAVRTGQVLAAFICLIALFTFHLVLLFTMLLVMGMAELELNNVRSLKK